MKFPIWVTPAPLPHPDAEAEGIFCWLIGPDSYVGKSTCFARSLREYEKNVSRLENGEAYRPGEENGFRAVHWALQKAKQRNQPIVWLVLEVCGDTMDLNERKAWWISRIRPNLNGVERDLGRKADV